MNATIAAAMIAGGAAIVSGGWTALVAITTSRHAAASTARMLDAARKDRIWDKQASTYTDTITAVQWRQARRNRELLRIKQHGELLPTEEPPVDWTELQGRLFAFASPEVLIALRAAGHGGVHAEAFGLELDRLIRKVEPRVDFWVREIDTTDEIERVISSAEQAVQDANDRDDTLIDVIRKDLHGQEECALDKLKLPLPKPEQTP